MSGDLWIMARNGTTLLPSEVKKLAADYDRLRDRLAAVKRERDGLTLHTQNLQSLVDKRIAECNRLHASLTALTSDAAVDAATEAAHAYLPVVLKPAMRVMIEKALIAARKTAGGDV